MSLMPEMKMGVLLGRSPAGTQVVATWALRVVPAGVPLRGPDMSLDMRLFAVSVETAGSDGPNPWLWAGAKHLADSGGRARPIQPRTSPLPRVDLVSGFRRQLVRPWRMKSRAEARTQLQVLGA